jgi:biotin carboxylase
MKKIAILGASYLQKPLLEKAIEMGLETHCFAWDNNESICKTIAHFFYPISVLEKEEILSKCIDIQIDGITTIATDICMPTIAFVAEKMNLIANTYNSSVLATNKERMRNAFEINNVNSPKSQAVSNFEENSFTNFKFPLIVKPTDRSGSRGVEKVENEAGLKSAIERAKSESIENRVIVEEFIAGNEVSVESISWNGEHHILAITDKITTEEPYFVELEHHQPSSLPNEIQNKLKKETLKALNALDIKFGASHTELKINKEGEVYLIEVGARMGGDFIGSNLVNLSTGFDYLKAVIEIALGNYNFQKSKNNQYAGVYFLCKETEYLLNTFNLEADYIIEKKILNSELKNIQNSNDRSGYIIYKSDEKINFKKN